MRKSEIWTAWKKICDIWLGI